MMDSEDTSRSGSHSDPILVRESRSNSRAVTFGSTFARLGSQDLDMSSQVQERRR